MLSSKQYADKEIKPRFGFRKTAFGLCGAMLGSVILGLGLSTTQAKADTVAPNANNSNNATTASTAINNSNSGSQSNEASEPQVSNKVAHLGINNSSSSVTVPVNNASSSNTNTVSKQASISAKNQANNTVNQNNAYSANKGINNNVKPGISSQNLAKLQNQSNTVSQAQSNTVSRAQNANNIKNNLSVQNTQQVASVRTTQATQQAAKINVQPSDIQTVSVASLKDTSTYNARKLAESKAAEHDYSISNGTLTHNHLSFDITFANAANANGAIGSMSFIDSASNKAIPMSTIINSDLTYNGREVGSVDALGWHINDNALSNDLRNIVVHANLPIDDFDQYRYYTGSISSGEAIYLPIKVVDNTTSNIIASSNIPITTGLSQVPQTVPAATMQQSSVQNPVVSGNTLNLLNSLAFGLSHDGSHYTGITPLPDSSHILGFIVYQPTDYLFSNNIPVNNSPITVTIPHEIDYIGFTDGSYKQLSASNANEISQDFTKLWYNDILTHYTKTAVPTVSVIGRDNSSNTLLDSTGKHTMYKEVESKQPLGDLTDKDFNLSVQAVYNPATGMDTYTLNFVKNNNDTWYRILRVPGSKYDTTFRLTPAMEAKYGLSHDGIKYTYVGLPIPNRTNFTVADLTNNSVIPINFIKYASGSSAKKVPYVNDLKKLYDDATAQKIANDLYNITVSNSVVTNHLSTSQPIIDLSHDPISIVTAERGQNGQGTIELVDDDNSQKVWGSANFNGIVGQFTDSLSSQDASLQDIMAKNHLVLDSGYAFPSKILVTKTSMEPIQLLVHQNITYSVVGSAWDMTDKKVIGSTYTFPADEAKNIIQDTQDDSSLSRYLPEFEKAAGNSNIDWSKYNYSLSSYDTKNDTVSGTEKCSLVFYFTHKTTSSTSTSDVVRHIVINLPAGHGSQSASDQKVSFNETTVTDLVTGQKTNTYVPTGGSMDSQTIPVVPGYTALMTVSSGTSTNNTNNATQIPSEDVNPTTPDSTVTINYSPNDETQKVIYQDEQKNPIHTTTVTGKTDQTVTIPNEVPDGWKIISGNVPGNVTLHATNPDIVVTIGHVIVEVPHDKPVNPGVIIPGTTGKTYPGGVQYGDLNSTVTRKVTIIDPLGKSTVTNQSVTFTRDATVDAVTSKVTYTPWSENGEHEFSAVPVPPVAGYTPSASAPAATVHPGDADSTLTITYNPNGQNTVIDYVDTKTGKIISTTPVSGKTDATTNLTYTAPEHWVIVSGQNLPTTYTFKADNNSPVTVKIDHKLDDRANDSRTITRTVIITNPQGKITTQTQPVTFTRTTQYDEVTGQDVHGDWSDGSQQTISEIDAPAIAGYAINGSAPVMVVTPDTKNSTVNINYIANGQSSYYQFVDDDYKTGDPDISQHHGFAGKTDQTVNLNITIPAHYELAKGQTIPTQYSFKASGNLPVIIHLAHGMRDATGDKDTDTEHTITRHIIVVQPGGHQTKTDQGVTFKRTATQDLVDGAITYGKWSNNGQMTMPGMSIPDIAGYTKSGDVPSKIVTPDTPDSTVTITYNANNQTQKVIYEDPTGKPVHTTTVNGKTDQTVPVPREVPDGWHIVKGKVPTSITLKPVNPDIVITIDHNHITVTPDNPKNPGDKIPGTISKTFPTGVQHDDLNSTVSRVVTIVSPTGDRKVTNQSVTFSRSADVDEVTGQVTYQPWSENGQHIFSAVPVPDVAGYTPSMQVQVAVVHPGDADSTLTVTYTANGQNVTVNYIDSSTGKTVTFDTVNGKTDQTRDMTYAAPLHWIIVPGQNLPTSYKFKADGNNPINVKVEHKLDNRPDDRRTITRTVNITDPQGKTTTEKQPVTFTRTTQFDEVTNQNVYGNWDHNGQQTINAVMPPVIKGYAINGSAPQMVVTPDTKDSVVNISYIANGQSSYYQFVDDDYKPGDPVINQHHDIAGKTDQTINLSITIPAHYNLAKGQIVPGQYTFKSSNNSPIIIHLVHGTRDATGDKDTDTEHTITRHIIVIQPSGHQTKTDQGVTFKRTATQDLVNGKITYGNWSNGGKMNMPGLTVPDIIGYTKSGDVPVLAVTPDSKDSTITITYKANDATQKVVYKDPSGNIIHTTIVPGKVAQTVTIPNEVPDGWEIVSGKVPTSVTLKPTNPDITVTIDHKHVTVTHNHPQKPGDLIPGTIGKKFPTGVDQSDLNDTITRTIKFVAPTGHACIPQQVQTVTFTRDADVDAVTGKVTYTAWSENGQHIFNEVDAPAITGYAPNGKAKAITVKPGDKDITVTIGYNATDRTQRVIYQDEDGNPIHITSITGRVGTTINIPNEVPDGWEIISGKLPSSEVVKDVNPDITVTIGHKHIIITHDNPATTGGLIPGTKGLHYPSGLTDTDLNKSLTRTIILRVPGEKDQDIQQVIKVWRDADLDEVTGQIVYTKWHAEKDMFPTYDVPDKPGFVPEKNKVMAQVIDINVPDIVVVINYHRVAEHSGSSEPTTPEVILPSTVNYFNWPSKSWFTIYIDTGNSKVPLFKAGQIDLMSSRKAAYGYKAGNKTFNNGYNNSYNGGLKNGNNDYNGFDYVIHNLSNGNNNCGLASTYSSVSPAIKAACRVNANTGNNNSSANKALPQTGQEQSLGLAGLGIVLVSLAIGMAGDRRRE